MNDAPLDALDVVVVGVHEVHAGHQQGLAIGRPCGPVFFGLGADADISESLIHIIQVSDPEIAEARLVPLALDGGGVTVCGFERQTQNLEDIFMHIVEESNHER